MTDDRKLLAEYVRDGSETAFRELVSRYFRLVYLTALRHAQGDAHLAEDITQTVFVDLARSAITLADGVLIGGWLYRRTCHVAQPVMRAQRRRLAREREAATMHEPATEPQAERALLDAHLDQAMMELAERERTVVMLRFFEELSFQAIAERTGGTPDAARMLSVRALAKLEAILRRQGVALSAGSLGAMLSLEASAMVPTHLVAPMASAAIAAKVAGGGGMLIFLKLMSTSKILVTGALIVAAGFLPTVLLRQETAALERQRAELAQDNANLRVALRREREEHERLRVQRPASGQAADEALRRELAKLRGQVGVLREQNAQLKRDWLNPTPSLSEWKPEELANQGRGTPLTTLQTMLWAAAGSYDAELIRSVMADPSDPQLDQETVQVVARHERPGILKASAVKVLRQVELPGDQVEVEFVMENRTAGGDLRRMTFQRSAEGWRAVVFADREPDGSVWHVGFEKVRDRDALSRMPGEAHGN